MDIYQLKLEGTNVEGMLDEISWMAAIATQSFGASAVEAKEAFPSIKNALKTILKNSLYRYEKCGRFACCDSGIAGRPITLKGNIKYSARPPKWTAAACKSISRYLLKPEGDIERFVSEMIDAAAKSLNVDILENRNPCGSFRNTLDIVIRSGLGKYVYSNEHCGQEDTCKKQKAMDPWK